MSTAECSSSSHQASEPSDVMDCSAADDEYLVQVRAQVMTRDDSSGGWLPTNGGGMSVVGVQANPAPADNHYMIRGRRVCDQAVVLNCAVTDDLLYVKATPTFHHWRTRGKRFGLTFHSSADAQVFETCIQRAAQQLQDKPSCDKGEQDEDEDSVMKLQPPPADATEVSSLPASRTRTPSPTATMRVRSTVGGPQRLANSFVCSAPYYPFSCPDLELVGNRSLYDRHAMERRGQLMRKNDRGTEYQLSVQSADGEPCCSDGAPVRGDGYVRFSRTDVTADSSQSVGSGPSQSTSKSSSHPDPILTPPTSSHDYEYPVLTASGTRPRDSAFVPVMQQVSLPRRKLRKGKKSGKRSMSSTRARCIYCQELFYVSENRSGSCPDAPDGCAACIEHATCLCAARALLYHCATDDDGSYGTVCGAQESSSPGSSGVSSARRRRRKWVIVALLSIVLPCLWCYPALTACHRCAALRGHCGARHKAA